MRFKCSTHAGGCGGVATWYSYYYEQHERAHRAGGMAMELVCDDCYEYRLKEDDDRQIVPELWDEIARKCPDQIMDEPEDSVPDVQVRAEDREVKACKWHGVRVEHPVPNPSGCSGHTFRADAMRSGSMYALTQIHAVEERLQDEYMERVVTWIRNNFREMPSCGGNPVSIETREDGREYWLCREHCNEEG